jgi:adenylate kinase family enzyme
MHRVVIVGCSGAGKSTLARRLSERTGLPVIHLDSHFWRPGRQGMPRVAWEERVRALVAGPRWIMDGDFNRTLAPRLAVADTVIIVKAPRWLCLLRVIRRGLRYDGRPDDRLASGCRLDWQILRDIWRYRRDHHPRVKKAIRGFRGNVVKLRSPAEADAFVAAVEHPDDAAACEQQFDLPR